MAASSLPPRRVTGRPAANRPGALTEHRLTTTDTAVTHIPGPVPAVIGVHHLKCPQGGPVKLNGHNQVRSGLRDFHDLDQWATDQRDLLSRTRDRCMQQMRGDVVQQRSRLAARPVTTSSGLACGVSPTV